MTRKRPFTLTAGRNRPAALLVGAALIAASTMAGGMAAFASPAPRNEPAAIGSTSYLRGVYCTSASSCWAVGSYQRNGAFFDETLRLRNHLWKLVAAPSPGGTKIGALSELLSVRCTAARSCWAVGDYTVGRATLSEALHWNGTKWSLVTTPDPGGKLSGDFNNLVDVSCNSATNCWAAGNYGEFTSTGEETLNLALHWNGKKWSQAATPNPGGIGNNRVSRLTAIRCTSTDSCWGVGNYGVLGPTLQLDNDVLHWNGKKWSKQSVPNPAGTASGHANQLTGLSCTSAGNCWAAGFTTTPGPLTLLNEMLHWNGSHWSTTMVPDPNGASGSANRLEGISCSSANSCVAVGALGSFLSTGFVINQALVWNGHKWSATSPLDPAGSATGDDNNLIGVRCESATDCWAVGDDVPDGKVDRQQIEFWDGKKWQTT
jgi:hypothetical protein